MSVAPLEKLDWDHRHDPERLCFDECYWMNVTTALEQWLRAKRMGIALPQERDASGRTVLEQLAYMPMGQGNAFCDTEFAAELESMLARRAKGDVVERKED